MANQYPQYIQTITVVEPTIPTENTDQNILEVEGILVNDQRIKPTRISVIPRPLSSITTIQMDLIEIPLDNQPNTVVSEQQDENEYSPPLIYCSYYRCCKCCSCCRCYTCHISKECALCIASFACITAIILTGVN